MKQKDLAEEYATARLRGRLSGNEVSFSDNKVFTEEDIKEAFNAGRESVVENIPELEWRKAKDDFLEAYALGAYYLIKLKHIEFSVAYNYNFIAKYLSLSEAKQAANEDYKKRIKQALGL